MACPGKFKHVPDPRSDLMTCRPGGFVKVYHSHSDVKRERTLKRRTTI
jgi:hypothetical protein